MKKAAIVWVLGLATFVPYGIYYLLFQAETQEYAFWIVAILFWIFGYWSLVGPLVTALKIRRIMKTMEGIKSKEDFMKLLHDPDNEDTAIKFLAQENSVPEFIARWAYKKMMGYFAQEEAKKDGRTSTNAKAA